MMIHGSDLGALAIRTIFILARGTMRGLGFMPCEKCIILGISFFLHLSDWRLGNGL